MAQTGKGATATFGSSSWSLAIKEIDLGEVSKEPVEDTPLSASKKTFIPGDVTDEGEATIDYYFDQSAASQPGVTSTPETITFTFPLKSAETVAATLAGTGMVTKVSRPKLMLNGLMMGKLTVKWNGKTGPSYTAGS